MNLEQAKQLFFLSNCSKFELGRDDPSAYKLYTELNIKKELENKWREEQLKKYFEDIKNKNNEIKLWNIFNRMYGLTESVKTKESISIMYKAVLALKVDLNENEKVIIAEIIIGRKARSCRSGLIYLSYDLGDKKSASLFASNVLELLENDFSDSNLRTRVQNAIILCKNIMDELLINRVVID